MDVPGHDLLGIGRVLLQRAEGVVDRGLAGVADAEQVDRNAVAGRGHVRRGVWKSGVRIDPPRNGYAANDLSRSVLHRVGGVVQEAADDAVEQVLVVLVLAELGVGVPTPASAQLAFQAANDAVGVVVGLVARFHDVQHAAAELGAERPDVRGLRRGQVGVVVGDVEPDEDVGRLSDLQRIGTDGAVGHGIDCDASSEPAFQRCGDVIGQIVVDV